MFILFILGLIPISGQNPYSVIDMDSFDCFIEKMKYADKCGDAALFAEVKNLCKNKYSPSMIKSAKTRDTQAYLARCYELGVVCKRFGYNFSKNNKKAYKYYKQSLGDKHFSPHNNDPWSVQVAYRMAVFLLNANGLEYEIKELTYEKIRSVAGWLILSDKNVDLKGKGYKPFYGYKPKAHLAARIISGEEGSYNSQPIVVYMYNDQAISKVLKHHPEVFQEAIKCYNIAADGGSPEVQMEYAAFLLKWSDYYGNGGYYYGEGYDDYYSEVVDYRGQGIYWYKMAAMQGFCPAIVNYVYYSIMRGGYNAQEIKTLLQHAADAGDVFAMYNLASICYSGKYGMKDIETAFKYALKGAEMNCIECASILAYFYEFGIGTNVNKQEAFKYYQQSADAGVYYSAYKTGEFYADEKYGHDMRKAFEYWEKTNGRVDEACGKLAYCYENGVGTIMDKSKAQYYRKLYKGRPHTTNFSILHYDVYLRSACKGDKLTLKIR